MDFGIAFAAMTIALVTVATVYGFWYMLNPQTFWQKLVCIFSSVVLGMIVYGIIVFIVAVGFAELARRGI